MRFVQFILNDNLNELFPEFLKNWDDEQCQHLRDLILEENPEAYQLAFGTKQLYCYVDNDYHAIDDVIKFEVLPDGNFYNEDIIRVQLTDWAVHHIDSWDIDSGIIEDGE